PNLETVSNINSIATKIGDIQGSNLYSINGNSTGDWIYLSNQSMSDSPVGLYKSSKLKMSLNIFSPNNITIHSMSISEQPQLVYETDQNDKISVVISKISNGKKISKSESEKIKMQKEYKIEFKSSKFPHLVYTYDYAESTDGRCIVSFGNDTFEIDSLSQFL
ncbi:MAG: hypothetical protein ABF904_14735, partial [Ethanoligenens sp.]